MRKNTKIDATNCKTLISYRHYLEMIRPYNFL